MNCHKCIINVDRNWRRSFGLASQTHIAKDETKKQSERSQWFIDYVIAKKEREQKHREKPETDWTVLRAEIDEFVAECDAERLRREDLSRRQRLREDGQKLQQKIADDDQMLVTLELSASERAKCCAKEDCLRQQINRYSCIAIVDKYRICVHGVENEDWFGRTRKYYHIHCFSHMFDLTALIPPKLKLDGGAERWPLMVQRWHQYKGQIDRDKIASHIDQLEAYIEEVQAITGSDIDWQLTH